MPQYVGLCNWTDQGARTAKDTVQLVEQSGAALEQLGVRVGTVSGRGGATTLSPSSRRPAKRRWPSP